MGLDLIGCDDERIGEGVGCCWEGKHEPEKGENYV